MSALAGVLFKRAGSAAASLFYKTGCSSWAEKCSQARGFLHATKRHQLFEDGENVKTVNLLKALGIALCVATASSAYAQASDAMASGDMGMAAPSAKSVKKTDRTLGLQVRKALAKAQGFDVSNVFVRARGGAVTLTGSVPNGAQIPQAEEVAKGVAGVKSVNNKITIGTQGGGGG
ncbi:osmotically-inducible protein OsmY [Paraburkholderia bryophila]|uniref:Osmotically-inducible protein OsmY n=1 Tax=Paraburkholderia bryophila TaxID=420952 RepID=A0A7Y9WA90_9BURK|nr:osmotically-inducible protein OsmY [Paraburkholderia bryophila]